MYIEFEWNPAKAASNLKKHGIGFQEASVVFLDTHAIFEQDREVDGEERWQAIGQMQDDIVVTMAHNIRERDQVDVYRIIYARLAEREEKERYEQQNG